MRQLRMRSERETFNIGQGRKINDERWVFLKDDPNFWGQMAMQTQWSVCAMLTFLQIG